MDLAASAPTDPTRSALVRRGRRLAILAIAYMGMEAAASLLAGAIAGSISLVGFGIDSLIEIGSNAAALHRMGADHDSPRRARAEHDAQVVIAWSFLLLALYVMGDALHALVRRVAPTPSPLGVLVAATSMVVMPLFARAKRRVARALESRALAADSRQADFCGYLSTILLAGLLLNAWLGWWWADPAAALVMAPIIAREGLLGLRGVERCRDC